MMLGRIVENRPQLVGAIHNPRPAAAGRRKSVPTMRSSLALRKRGPDPFAAAAASALDCLRPWRPGGSRALLCGFPECMPRSPLGFIATVAPVVAWCPPMAIGDRGVASTPAMAR